MRHLFLIRLGTLLALMAMASTGCRQPDADTAAATTTPAAEPEYQPDATVKDLMQSVVDTSADVVWLSVTTVVDEQGITDTVPRSDEEWTTVRNGALTLAEAANLLMIPGRHVARPGEKSEVPGIELEPEEMEAMIDEDRAGWNQRAIALHDAAMVAVHAAEAHDADTIFEVGARIENACEGCHKQYWYPNEVLPPAPNL